MELHDATFLRNMRKNVAYRVQKKSGKATFLGKMRKNVA